MAIAGLLVVALLLPVVAAVWQRPQRGVLLLLVLLPFDGLLLLVDVPPPVTAWKEALLALTLLAALQPRLRPSQPRPVPAWVWPAALLFTLSILALLWAPPLQALVGIKVTFFGMLTAAVVWRCPLTARDRDLAVTLLAATGTVVAVVGLGQQVLGPERLHELGYEYNSTIRFTGGWLRSWSTFNQPFPFAFFLMAVTLVAGSVALDDPDRLRNRLVLAALPLLVAGMAVAVVRAAWIGLLVGAVYLALTRHRVLLAAAPVVLGTVAVALVLGMGAFFVSPSVAARLDRWEQIPGLVTAAPFGEGIGTAGAAAAKTEALSGGVPTYDPVRMSATRVVFQPDNTYVKVLYELGVIGLGLFVLALLAAFAASRRAEADPEMGPFAAGVSALLLAASVASLAASLFEIFPLDYVIWLLVGIATSAPAARPRPALHPAVVPARSGA